MREIDVVIPEGFDISKIGLQYPKHVDSAINFRTAELINVVFDKRIIESTSIHFGKD